MTQVLNRELFNFAVVNVAMTDLLSRLTGQDSLRLSAAEADLSFPHQAYNPAPDSPPMLFWTPACLPTSTAFMPQASSGDCFVVNYACKHFGFRGVAVRSTTQAVEWPINEFCAYEANAMVRFVRVMRDSPNWEFHQEGEALSFEDTARYGARLVRDRFDRERLLDYLEHWGAPVRNADFWRSNQPAMTLVRHTS